MSKKEKLRKENYEQELYIKELENEKLKLEVSLKETRTTEKLGKIAVLKQTMSFAEEVVKGFSEVDLKDDKAVFSKAFGYYNKAQQQNFVMENLLEGLKRGEPLNKLLKTYGGIGLIEKSLTSDINKEEKVENAGSFMTDVILKGLKKSVLF